MSHYPIYVDLHRRAVLLAGGGTVAERKAESLINSGARLTIVSPTLTPRLREWHSEGKIDYRARTFSPSDLNGVYLVIAATENHESNRRVYLEAEARAIFCNTVDTADLCSFIVPAVIDRSPIKIAISSGGNAPVLARRWKRILETLIPFHTGTMAQIAGKWRNTVKRRISDIKTRRQFWEKLFESRFETFSAQNNTLLAEKELLRLLQQQSAETGEVALVGAGPGDPGLLTIHALHAIQAADTVLHDALVSDDILALIRKDAVKISVGKRAGNHSIPQEETNRLLIEYARKGQRVVRLKGGDPFIFGRGGEEVEILKNAGIPYRIVPGITAALGAAAYSGIPLTHRNLAHSVQFVTGHSQTQGTPPDWRMLAQNRQTLVIYMGTLRAEEIAQRLIRHGRHPDTPAAIISNGTSSAQTTQTTRLKDLPAAARNAPRPALIIIGEVAALHHELAWFQEQSTPASALSQAA